MAVVIQMEATEFQTTCTPLLLYTASIGCRSENIPIKIKGEKKKKSKKEIKGTSKMNMASLWKKQRNTIC